MGIYAIMLPSGVFSVAHYILNTIQKMYPFTRNIHCSIQQSASHCCSLSIHFYISIQLISGLHYLDAIQIECFHKTKSSIQIIYLGRDPDNSAPCKRINRIAQQMAAMCLYPAMYSYNSNIKEAIPSGHMTLEQRCNLLWNNITT